MRKATVLASASVATLLLGSAALQAHHGWGSYDAAKPVTVEGPVMQLSFQNPHATIRLKGPDKEWTITLAPISRMMTRGATEDKIAVGKTVTAYGYPSKVQPDEMRAEWIKANGETYQLR
jgi:hypothetical protein